MGYVAGGGSGQRHRAVKLSTSGLTIMPFSAWTTGYAPNSDRFNEYQHQQMALSSLCSRPDILAASLLVTGTQPLSRINSLHPEYHILLPNGSRRERTPLGMSPRSAAWAG